MGKNVRPPPLKKHPFRVGSILKKKKKNKQKKTKQKKTYPFWVSDCEKLPFQTTIRDFCVKRIFALTFFADLATEIECMSVRLKQITLSETNLVETFVKNIPLFTFLPDYILLWKTYPFSRFCQIRYYWMNWITQSALKKYPFSHFSDAHAYTRNAGVLPRPTPPNTSPGTNRNRLFNK